jgi:hypothetical protein
MRQRILFVSRENGHYQNEITFSPHKEAEAPRILDNKVSRMNQEKKTKDGSIPVCRPGYTTKALVQYCPH